MSALPIESIDDHDSTATHHFKAMVSRLDTGFTGDSQREKLPDGDITNIVGLREFCDRQPTVR